MGESQKSVFDVAKYILKKQESLSAMKLQKLVYYCQAWSLVWDDTSMFDEEIQAWASGPVVPELFQLHKGKYLIDSKDLTKGNTKKLSGMQIKTIDDVLQFYGDKNSQWLSDLTHSEKPWNKAREGLAPGEKGNKTITLESMAEYYSSIT